MKRALVAFALLTVTACSGERLTGPAAEDAARQYQSASVAPANSPLFVLDGKEISVAQARSIDSKTIESVQVFKGRAALQQYGQRANNGVVVIQSKSSAGPGR